LATLLIGWQIYSIVNFNSYKNDIEKEMDRLKERIDNAIIEIRSENDLQMEAYSQQIREYNNMICSIITAEQEMKRGNHTDALNNYFTALEYSFTDSCTDNQVMILHLIYFLLSKNRHSMSELNEFQIDKYKELLLKIPKEESHQVLTLLQNFKPGDISMSVYSRSKI